MLSKRVLVSFMCALAMPTGTFAQNSPSFLCIADMATGYKFNSLSKRWEETSFRTEDSRYIFRQRNGADGYEVRRFGNELVFADALCEKGINEAGFIHCAGLGGRFVMNVHNLRYQHYSQGLYIAYNPTSETPSLRTDGGDTPYIEIGRCTRL